jgi:hypothetical protein
MACLGRCASHMSSLCTHLLQLSVACECGPGRECLRWGQKVFIFRDSLTSLKLLRAWQSWSEHLWSTQNGLPRPGRASFTQRFWSVYRQESNSVRYVTGRFFDDWLLTQIAIPGWRYRTLRAWPYLTRRDVIYKLRSATADKLGF